MFNSRTMCSISTVQPFNKRQFQSKCNVFAGHVDNGLSCIPPTVTQTSTTTTTTPTPTHPHPLPFASRDIFARE